jgi:heme exporter protein A
LKLRLVVEGLACARGGRTLFDGVDFALSQGDALRVSGPNGAGKTSLLRLLAGLLAPAHGRVAFAGTESPGEAAHLLGHQDAIKGGLSVAENLEFWSAVLGGGSIDAALAAVGIARLAPLPARVLSAGQKRRLALARLLVATRPLWLLDEPASGLDADGQNMLAGMIGGHLKAGGIVVVAAHGAPEFPATREIRLGGGA